MEFRSRVLYVKLNGVVKVYGVGGGGSRVLMYLVVLDVDVLLEDFE